MNWKKIYQRLHRCWRLLYWPDAWEKTLAGYTPATYEAKAEEITLQEETTQSTEEKGQQTSKTKQKNKESHKNRKQKESGKRKL